MTTWDRDRETLNQLVAKGMITEDDIAKAQSEAATLQFDRDIIDTIHSVMCGADHDTDECLWYMEEQLPNTWELTFHRLWTTFTSNPIKLVPESTSEDLASGSDSSGLSG